MQAERLLFRLTRRDRGQVMLAAFLVATAALMLVVYSETLLGFKASIVTAWQMGGPEDITVTSQSDLGPEIIARIGSMSGVRHIAPVSVETLWTQRGWVEFRYVNTADEALGLSSLVAEGRLPSEPSEVAGSSDFLTSCGLSLGESFEAWEKIGEGPIRTFKVVGVLKNTMRTPWSLLSFLWNQPARSLLVYCDDSSESAIRAVEKEILSAIPGVKVVSNYNRDEVQKEFVPIVNRAVQVLLVAVLISTVLAMTNSIYLRLSSRVSENLVLSTIGVSDKQILAKHVFESAVIAALSVALFGVEAFSLSNVVRPHLVWTMGQVVSQGAMLTVGAVAVSSGLAWLMVEKPWRVVDHDGS